MARRVLVLALVAGLAGAASAPAAQPAPRGFFGTTLMSELASPRAVSDPVFDAQVALMARSGVESLRVVVGWNSTEPTPGRYDWTTVDRLVRITAQHGLTLLPNMSASPRWASTRPGDAQEYYRYPPKDPRAYARLMRQMVLRYGPRGAFWAQNPRLPRRPIRLWQIWNEPTAPWYWRQTPFARSYTRLLRASYRAIHAADRGAKVAVGGLVAPRADYAPWDSMRDLYRAGAKRFFDVVSVHPFTNDARSVRITVRQTLEIVRRVRAEMRRRGDGRKQVILTEMTWPASAGRIPREAAFGLETTARGQAARLRLAYHRLLRVRRKLRIAQVYWYTWASEYDNRSGPSVMSFRYTGLTRFANGTFTPMPLLRTYASVARR